MKKDYLLKWFWQSVIQSISQVDRFFFSADVTGLECDSSAFCHGKCHACNQWKSEWPLIPGCDKFGLFANILCQYSFLHASLVSDPEWGQATVVQTGSEPEPAHSFQQQPEVCWLGCSPHLLCTTSNPRLRGDQENPKVQNEELKYKEWRKTASEKQVLQVCTKWVSPKHVEKTSVLYIWNDYSGENICEKILLME